MYFKDYQTFDLRLVTKPHLYKSDQYLNYKMLNFALFSQDVITYIYLQALIHSTLIFYLEKKLLKKILE
jgi:hypothetical protein